ncbi:MAG: protein kinase [Candidatus Aminicenantes bacterium]|nr:protein kinase [Candidatus Aminicenantes bacterium]
MDAFPGIPGYRIEKKLGQGRLADAYLAIKEETEQKVVIKVLLPQLARTEDEEFAKLFLFEARKAAKLDHPNIAKILDVGETTNCYYFVMEYFQECLRARISNRDFPSGFETGREGDAPRDAEITEGEIRQIMDIFRQLFDALDYAYQEEIIHRDIRPENIFFRDEAGFITPVITDFCMQQVAAISKTLDEKGLTLKDIHYTSPEAILNESQGNSGDFYSLGVTLFEMLTGHVPYDAEDPAAMENLHKTAPIPQLPGHLSILQPLLDRLLAKTKDERAQGSAELILLIEELNEDLMPELMIETAGDEIEDKIEDKIEDEKEDEIETEIENKIEDDMQDEIRVKMGPGFGQEIEMASGTAEKNPETRTENLELGEEIRKEIEEQKSKDQDSDLYPAPGERAPRHPFEPMLTKDTGGMDSAKELFSKLQNPRVFIPAAAAIIIIIVLAVVFLKPKAQPGAGKPEETIPGQEIAGDSQDIQYTRKLKQAQRVFEMGDYEKALQHITEAEKIKPTPEVETLKRQIQEKITEKQDDIVFQKALKTGGAAALEDYLSKYPSGLHAAPAREKMTELNELERKHSEKIRKWAAAGVTLRSTPQTLDKAAVRAMVKKRGFFEKYYNSTGDFLNHYELQTINNQKVIMDYAAGLMWLQGGSEQYMKYEKVQPWIEELNRRKYAGFSDWRLPTLEEAASLMESQENRDALYIDPLFSKDQNHTWTADMYDQNRAWAVDIFGGDFNPVDIDYDSFVRPVRSVK